MLFYTMIFAVLCAYFVKGMCGFANTLVFSALMSFTVSNARISPLDLLVGYPSNVILAVQNRKRLSVKIWLPLSLLVLAGDVPGIFLLKNTDAKVLKLVFGFVILFLAAEMFLRERQQEKKQGNRLLLAGIGICSGLLCGLFGIGAMLAAYIGRTTDDSEAFKGNLAVVFFLESTFRIAAYTATGILTAQIFEQAVLLLPAMLAGLFLGMKAARHVREKTVKTAVVLLLAFSGVSLIAGNL